MLAYLINPVVGTEVIKLPEPEKRTYLATEVAKMLNTTPNKIGSTGPNGPVLKKPEYDHFVLDNSRHSSKQVEAFIHNIKEISGYYMP